MRTCTYDVWTPLGRHALHIADDTVVSDFLDALVTVGLIYGGDILELSYDGITVPNDLTFGALNLYDGYRFDVLASGRSV